MIRSSAPPGRHAALALTLVALGIAPGAAHVLEMPVKLGYPPELYAAVTGTLYAGFGPIGGGIQVVALVVVAALAFRTRGHPGAAALVAATGALAASLALWAALVAPVNATWADARHASPEDLVASYAALRNRWEFGHLAAFIAWCTGWVGLVSATVDRAPRPVASR